LKHVIIWEDLYFCLLRLLAVFTVLSAEGKKRKKRGGNGP
jgi:hypothetical protein